MRIARHPVTRRTLAIATATAGALAVLAGVAAPAQAASCSKPGRDDINGDGFADAVVTEYGAGRLAGRVHVFYGTPDGLTAKATGTAPDDRIFSQNTKGVPSTSEPMDEWGAALAMGDLNGDGCSDLAVGAPGENGAAGAVTILFGSPAGLKTGGALSLRQGFGEVPGVDEPNDRFGNALAAGDFDGNGLADLAIGLPGESLGAAYQAGAVVVLYGSKYGFTKGRAGRWLAQGPAWGTPSESNDRFGTTLAAADFDGTGPADLAIGVPGEDRAAGGVHVLLSNKMGVAKSAPLINRATAGVPGEPTSRDGFAAALAAGDIDGDGRADLAVGIPGEEAGAGAVSVLYSVAPHSGGGSGVTGARADRWTQSSVGMPGVPKPGDGFGSALAIGKLNKGGYGDLAIGVPADDVGLVQDAGTVHVLMGSAKGLVVAGNRLLHQNLDGVTGVAAPGDRFGLSVRASRVMGGVVDNLIVGVPAEGVAGTNTQNAGAFQVFGRSSTGPTATKSRLWTLADAGVAGDPQPGAFLGYLFG